MHRALGQRRAARAENRRTSETPPSHPEKAATLSDIPGQTSGGTGTVGAEGAPHRPNRATDPRTFARRVGDVITLKRMRRALGQRRKAKAEAKAAADAEKNKQRLELFNQLFEQAKPFTRKYLIFTVISMFIAFLAAIGSILLGLTDILRPRVVIQHYEGTPEVGNQGTIQGFEEREAPQQDDGPAGTEAGGTPAATTAHPAAAADAPSD